MIHNLGVNADENGIICVVLSLRYNRTRTVDERRRAEQRGTAVSDAKSHGTCFAAVDGTGAEPAGERQLFLRAR